MEPDDEQPQPPRARPEPRATHLRPRPGRPEPQPTQTWSPAQPRRSPATPREAPAARPPAQATQRESPATRPPTDATLRKSPATQRWALATLRETQATQPPPRATQTQSPLALRRAGARCLETRLRCKSSPRLALALQRRCGKRGRLTAATHRRHACPQQPARERGRRPSDTAPRFRTSRRRCVPPGEKPLEPPFCRLSSRGRVRRSRSAASRPPRLVCHAASVCVATDCNTSGVATHPSLPRVPPGQAQPPLGPVNRDPGVSCRAEGPFRNAPWRSQRPNGHEEADPGGEGVPRGSDGDAGADDQEDMALLDLLAEVFDGIVGHWPEC